MDKRWERMEIKKENITIDTSMSVATFNKWQIKCFMSYIVI
jgi:hypothetical protein